jgi:hypothetical protein
VQDEITKHTKKIYDAVKSSNHSAGDKVKEVIIEIFIIVFAVTLSIWLHSWSEKRHDEKEVTEFLKGLKNDLNKDKVILEENKKTISRVDSNFKVLLKYDKGEKDKLNLEIDIPVTRLNIGRYEGFKSSGKIGNIENESLKQNILTFYEQALSNLSYNENFVNSWQLKILDFEIDRNEKQSMEDLLSTNKMKSLLRIGGHNLEISIEMYADAIKQADKIIAQIDKEMAD